jgi:hypothetical protein
MSEDNDARPKAKNIERLERALAEETRTSAQLRDSLEALQDKVASLEMHFEKRLGEAAKRYERAEAKLIDQQDRLNALGVGREDSMRALTETRAALARVVAERDQLQKQFARIDGMQTETIALTDSDDEEPAVHSVLSLDELMASLPSMEQAPNEGLAYHTQAVPNPDPDDSVEMISPELVFPEEFGERKSSAGRSGSRVLVYLDAQPPIKYPLYKDLITIGRSSAADIQIEDDFISRVHARIICDDDGVIIEDVQSKNGIKVNSRHVSRHLLQHGDVIGFGKLRFTYVETTAAERGD